MKSIKHVGILKNTGAKILVVFRTLPGESNYALVLPTATLPDMYHNSIIGLVESDEAQEANEFGEIMFVRRFPDGRPMLQAMQEDNRLQKMPTDQVLMTPTLNTSIQLDQLNVLIAEQKNMAVDELSSLVMGAKPKTEEPKATKLVEENFEVNEIAAVKQVIESTEPLSDKDMARNYRSQADALYKEAAKLRRQADDLDPPQKKAVAKEKETAGA